MTVILLVVLNIFIINVWLWISETVFSLSLQQKKKIFFSLLGVIIGTALRAYPKILALLERFLDIGTITMFTPKSISVGSGGALLVYCMLIIALLLFIIFKKPTKRDLIGSIGIALLMLICIHFGVMIGIGSVALYYLGVATSEELMKYFTGATLSKDTILPTDQIVRVIIVALGFSFIENIFYMLPVRDSLLQGLAVITNRGAIGFLMHSVFTGVIALCSIKLLPQKTWGSLVGLIAGVGIHFVYNTVIALQYTRVMILLIIAGYCVLSYLLYSSDRLYIEDL